MLKKQHLLNIFAIIFLLAFLFVIESFSESSNNAVSNNNFATQNYPHKISGKAKVTDGDSIEINGKKIRLLGIDAPEYKQKCFDEKQNSYNCGKVSYKFLLNLAAGKNIDCFYQKKDIYGRFLSYCFVDKTSISNEILANGMAVIYSFKYASKEEIILENTARKNKQGIWRGPFELPKDYRKRNRK